jgi:hypothetical protein
VHTITSLTHILLKIQQIYGVTNLGRKTSIIGFVDNFPYDIKWHLSNDDVCGKLSDKEEVWAVVHFGSTVDTVLVNKWVSW